MEKYKGFVKFISCDNVIRILYRRFSTTAALYNVQLGLDEPTITICPPSNEYTESFDENYRWLLWILPFISDICDEPIIAIGFDKIKKEMENMEKSPNRSFCLSLYDKELMIDVGINKKNVEGG